MERCHFGIFWFWGWGIGPGDGIKKRKLEKKGQRSHRSKLGSRYIIFTMRAKYKTRFGINTSTTDVHLFIICYLNIDSHLPIMDCHTQDTRQQSRLILL